MELIQGAEISKWTVHSNHSIRCFTKGEIDKVTRNYTTLLGRGSFGEVYGGVLEDQSKVAVKRFIHNVKENFVKELTVHREVNHRNVVRLIGYCIEENSLMMITEYISNGNLSDALHHDNSPIPLDIRLRIAIECAEALVYMHSHMYTHVVHGDIKPANILLDGNFHAKLSDFGISRLLNTEKTQYTENVVGSIGYMDPLFARDGLLTSKSDVYSFGVVLLELITRKKATAQVGEPSIVYLFTDAPGRKVRAMRDMFDSEISSKNNMRIVEGIAKLAGECLRMERDRRPEMIDVAQRLRILSKASNEGQQQVGLFSWTRKSKPAPRPIDPVWSMRASQELCNCFPGTSSLPVGVGEISSIPNMTISTETLPSYLCRRFTFSQMKDATKNFYQPLLVDEGAFGRVYRGQIGAEKTKVDIKRRAPGSLFGLREFRTEIEMSSKLRHHHLVQVIGYCDEMDEMILVYDYMAHGCLRDQLYRRRQPPLPWSRRLEICIGAARGLECLHESNIIFRNLKTADILLDDKWVAKLTDLALCTTAGPSADETTRVMGSGGFLDPEYVMTGRLTVKSDVYSFGGVLLEVLCARPIPDPYLPDGQAMFVGWALECKKHGKLDQIVDPYLNGTIDQRSLETYVGIAEKCLAYEGVHRPSMGDVLSELELALRAQGTVQGLSPAVQ